MKRRVVLLLSAPELTPRQLAQRKYQKSVKGRAASRRYQRKRLKEPAYAAANRERVNAWNKANRATRRVYKRIWQRTNKQRPHSYPSSQE